MVGGVEQLHNHPLPFSFYLPSLLPYVCSGMAGAEGTYYSEVSSHCCDLTYLSLVCQGGQGC